MSKSKAAEEALCSLYRLEAKAAGNVPCDVSHAMGALEFLVFSDPATKARMERFKARLLKKVA